PTEQEQDAQRRILAGVAKRKLAARNRAADAITDLVAKHGEEIAQALAPKFGEAVDKLQRALADAREAAQRVERLPGTIAAYRALAAYSAVGRRRDKIEYPNAVRAFHAALQQRQSVGDLRRARPVSELFRDELTFAE